ncbi:MAG: ATP-binding protein [Coriobacteriales bacterium]|jgi:SpoVK/Ycf46/Vps4 family AAA+-type ATPase|nr:ATP-binding protein [Coriobacteriales bacterium]
MAIDSEAHDFIENCDDSGNSNGMDNPRSLGSSEIPRDAVVAQLLEQAQEAQVGGRGSLAIHLYCAAFRMSLEQGGAPTSDAIDGLRSAWLLACEQGDKQSAESIFSDFIPYCSVEQAEYAFLDLHDLLMSKFREFDDSSKNGSLDFRKHASAVLVTFAQSLELLRTAEIAPEERIDELLQSVRVLELGLDAIELGILNPMSGVGAVAAVPVTANVNAEPEIGESASASISNDVKEDISIGDSFENLMRAVAFGMTATVVGDESTTCHAPVPTKNNESTKTSVGDANANVGEDVVANSSACLDVSQHGSVRFDSNASFGAGLDIRSDFNVGTDTEVGADFGAANSYSADASHSTNSGTGSNANVDTNDADIDVDTDTSFSTSTSAAAATTNAASNVSSDKKNALNNEKDSVNTGALFSSRKSESGSSAQGVRIDLGTLAHNLASQKNNGKDDNRLRYLSLSGFQNTLQEMREFGFQIPGDHRFADFLAAAQEYHGIKGLVLSDTFLFYGPSREDTALFAMATAGEIGRPVVNMDVGLNVNGGGTIKVTTPIKKTIFGSPRPTDLPEQCTLVIQNIDILQELFRREEEMLGHPYSQYGDLEFNTRSFGQPFGSMRCMQSEILSYIDALLSNNDVVVIATSESGTDIDPDLLGAGLLEVLSPISEIEVGKPTQHERFDVIATFAAEHNSLKELDFTALSRLTEDLGRYDIARVCQNAVESAYRETLRSRRQQPVSMQTFLNELSLFLDRKSAIYEQVEDMLVEMFSQELPDSFVQ